MAKITLSPFEATLVNNSEWILTKHTIIHKAGELLAAQVPAVNELFVKEAIAVFPGLQSCRPKISKGEKYLGLPYVILDYPALFSREDVLALRTMFWWGNFISVTLHLSGKYKKAIAGRIAVNLEKEGGQFYLSVGAEEWAHHFDSSNYQRVHLMDKDMLYKKTVQPSFVKIALKYDLTEWDNMDQLLQNAYSRLAALLKA